MNFARFLRKILESTDFKVTSHFFEKKKNDHSRTYLYWTLSKSDNSSGEQ